MCRRETNKGESGFGKARDRVKAFVMFIGTLCCNPLCPYTCRNKL
jgi:hypothetical protein